MHTNSVYVNCMELVSIRKKIFDLKKVV